MDRAEAALLRRVRMTVTDASFARGELHLDGWPLLLVDRTAGCVRVNDLRSRAMFTHCVALPPTDGHLSLRAGAVGDELYLLVGDVAAAFVVPEFASGVHADVRVVESSTGRLLLERSVRYRQLLGWPMSPPPAFVDCQR